MLLPALLLIGCGSSTPDAERQQSVSSHGVDTPAEFFEMQDEESVGEWSARTRAVTAHWREEWEKLVQGMPEGSNQFVGTLVQASGQLVEREPGRWRVTTFSGVQCVVLLPGEEPDVTVAANERPIVTFAGMVQSISGEQNRVTVKDCVVMSIVSQADWDELQTRATPSP